MIDQKYSEFELQIKIATYVSNTVVQTVVSYNATLSHARERARARTHTHTHTHKYKHFRMKKRKQKAKIANDISRKVFLKII